jgi:hypothetical protein
LAAEIIGDSIAELKVHHSLNPVTSSIFSETMEMTISADTYVSYASSKPPSYCQVVDSM